MRLKLFIAFIFFTTYCFSQPYGNDWIKHSQSYYKFEISRDGIYKINRAALLNAGFPISTINPNNLQIFSKGKEIPLYIKGESDGIFDLTDYIEFYAEKNNSWIDSLLYDKPEDVMNPYTSLLTDISTYYLTWNNKTTNLRFSVEADQDFSNYPKLDYFWFTSLKEYFNTSAKGYSYGPEYAYKGNAAGFQRGEGFIEGTLLASGKSYSKPITTKNAYTSGPDGEISISQVFISDAEINSGLYNHHIKIEYTGLTFDTLFKGFTLLKRTLPLKSSGLTSLTTPIKFTAVNDIDTKGLVDNSSLAYISITYPHTFDMENLNSFKIKLSNQNAIKSIVELFNFNGKKGNVLLFDMDNRKRISFVTISDSLGIYKGIIPNSGTDKNCFLIAEPSITLISKLTKVDGTAKFTDYTSVKDYNYIIITHKSLLASAINYQTYRNSTGHKTLVVDIEQIYDQFGYGVAKNPLAIRYFIDFALDKWTIKPEYLLLLGKSVSADHRRASALGYTQNLVPTFGVPGSDQMIVAGLNNTKFDAPLSIGRISAKSPASVDAYLNKLQEFESNKTAEWMKNSLFFSGGNLPEEQKSFREYIEDYASIFKQAPFGGTFFMKSKTSSAPFESSLQDSVRNIINNGATLLTMFGHSGGGISTIGIFGNFDISIDRVEEWNNKGKYPFMIANSCYSGNIHAIRGNTISSSESYVLTPNKGVIGYYAHTGAGYPYPLHVITKELFENISINNYGMPIGKIIQTAINNIQKSDNNEFYRSLFFNEQYHGDPAIILNAQAKPEFEISNSSIFYSPSIVTTELSNYNVKVIVTNIGRATDDSVIVRLTHKFPNNQKPDTTYFITLPPVYYKDTATFLIPTDILNGVGVNDFTATLDPYDLIDELDPFDNKNTATSSLFIKSAIVTPISPYEYSVIPNNQVTLKAVTNDPFLKEQKYVMQLDTSGNFNSPFLKTNKLSQKGGVIEWKMPFNLIEKQVYFWRVSPDSSEEKVKYVWKSSSFQYIQGKSGWGQSHFHQFSKNKFKFLNPNESKRTYEYVTTGMNYHSYSHNKPNSNEYARIGFDIDGCCGQKDKCGASSKILIAIIDPSTLEPLEAWDVKFKKGYRFGQVTNANCRSIPEKYFQYFSPTASSYKNTILDSVFKKVPNGYYVGIFSWGSINWHNFSQETKDYFTNVLKSKAFTKNINDTTKFNLMNGQSYGFFTQIGNPSKTKEVFLNGIGGVDLNAQMENSFIYGEITSEKIGPSLGWENAQWDFTLEDSDSSNVDIIGEKDDTSETILFSNLTSQKGSIDLSSVDRKIYPNIRLNYFTQDSVKYTPANLKEWYVFLKGVGDATINPLKLFSISADTIGAGDPIKIAIAIENISDYDMDSMLVSFYIEDANRIIHKLPNIKYKPLLAGDTLIATIFIETTGLLGLNKLWIEVNPNNNQPEKFRFNNFATIDFYVTSDKSNPILDATFDGKHILNGDIVSPIPEILIKMTDEHKFLALDDTALIKIYLTPPSGEKRQIRFTNLSSQDYTIEWIPAQLPDNSFIIKYKPKFIQDGKYTLSVQGKDKSNNYSGAREYSIDFEVINKSSITKVVNWPNPFTTSTRFVFELTGSNIPNELKIQIMNISGVVVKEITKEEIGEIRIGRNITQYAWNGTDEFGDKLANGVYFYNVIAKFNGKSIDNRNSNADQFFHKGFGKMYLMR